MVRLSHKQISHYHFKNECNSWTTLFEEILFGNIMIVQVIYNWENHKIKVKILRTYLSISLLPNFWYHQRVFLYG